nr:lytic transglycosylase [Accumulibacter sp.]
MKFCRALLFLQLLLASALAFAQGSDEQFLAARDAARAGDRAKLERLAPLVQGHELEAYVEYWQLLPDLKDSEPETVRAFLIRHENSYIAEKLRTDWLRQLGKAERWELFDAEYARLPQPDQDLVCYSLQSRRARRDARVLDDSLPLWLNLLEPPESCYPILEALIIEKRVLADAVWARIRRQFEANKLTAA